MKLLKFSVLFAIGGALGLLIVPLLPDATQNQVASLQDKVYKVIRKAEVRAGFRSTMDEAIVKEATLEILVHKLINNERVNYGMEPLSIDRDLSEVARGHSQDMSIMNFFAHENLLGQAPTDRADAKGYQCRKDYGPYYTEGVAENIFQGWLFSSTVRIGPSHLKSYLSLEEVATRVVDGWMESPGHRENILNPTYDRVGTGIAISKDEKVYLTQNFC